MLLNIFIYQAALGTNYQGRLTIHGILAVEHSGIPTYANDGMCITCLASLVGYEEAADCKSGRDVTVIAAAKLVADYTDSTPESVDLLRVINPDFSWVKVKDCEISAELVCRMRKHMTVPTNRTAEFEVAKPPLMPFPELQNLQNNFADIHNLVSKLWRAVSPKI